jgi:hypothetical protein
MRNPNVQQQNAVLKDQIRKLASDFHRDPLSRAWLIVALRRASLPVDQGILVQLEEIPEQEGELFKGCWLTTQRQFFSFQVIVPRRDEELISVDRWEDVTTSTAINGHLRGRGKSFGYLALEVMEEILRIRE